MSAFKVSLGNIFSKKNKALLYELVITDFKLRYQNSFLGYAWSLLKPLGLFSVIYVVFTKVFRFGDSVPNFPVYLLLGIVLWSFFLEATGGALNSIVGRGDLIRKISFPKYIIVISGTISALINLFLSLAVVIVFAFFSHVDFGAQILYAPFLIAELYVLALGIGLVLSALYVNFRDLSHIWEVLMQATFYAVPVIYTLQFVMQTSQKAAQIMMLNPIAQIIQDLRYSLVTKKTITTTDLVSFPLSLVPYILVLVSLVFGTAYFKKRSRYFAEQI